MHIHLCASVYISLSASIQTGKHASMQACKHAGTRAQIHACMRAHNKSYLSTKDPVPSHFKSSDQEVNLVTWVAPTHYNTRRNQHLGMDVNSSIIKHLKSNKECEKAYAIWIRLKYWTQQKALMNWQSKRACILNGLTRL